MKTEFKKRDVIVEIGGFTPRVVCDVGVGFYLCKTMEHDELSKYVNVRLEEGDRNYVKIGEWKWSLV